MALTIVLNGSRRTFEGLSTPASVSELVTELGLKADRVAVERNGEIAARTTWTTRQIVGDDKLEVVHFVGGG